MLLCHKEYNVQELIQEIKARKSVGRPRSERMAEALKRVAAGETGYKVARELGIAESQLYREAKKLRARQSVL